MSKRRYLLLLSALLLSSCAQGSYRQYFGNMELVSFSLPYSEIDEKAIVSDDWKEAVEEERRQEIQNTPSSSSTHSHVVPRDPVLEKTYYAEIFVLSTQTQLDAFFSLESLSFTKEDRKEYGFMPQDIFYVVVISQIPEGYESFKRENVQSTDEDGNMVIISDNFYSFANRPEINYFFIDLRHAPDRKEHVFSFLFEVPRQYLENISETTIRPIYSWGKK